MIQKFLVSAPQNVFFFFPLISPLSQKTEYLWVKTFEDIIYSFEKH